MGHRNKHFGSDLAEEIRRQAGSEATRRFMAAQPLFRLDADIPEQIRHLLKEIDRAEARFSVEA